MRRSVIRSGVVTGVVALTVLSLGGGSVAATSSTTTSSSPSESSSGSAGAPARLSEPQGSSEGVEVSTYGTATVRPYQQADNPPVVAAVHGVQRVEGATVVYYSMGWNGEEPDPKGLSEQSAPGATNGRYTNGGSMASVRVVDIAAGQVYRTVTDPETAGGAAPSPFGSPTSAFPQEPGVMGTMFAVLPELPESTEVVDVDLLFGVSIPDVPVQDGLLEPMADPTGVVPLGTGWPEVEESKVSDIEPEGFVFPLAAVTEALDNSQVVTEEGETVTIDLAADVLFAFDKADLSAAAKAKLAEITQRLVADEATGAVTIVGHTDNAGSDSYNLDLSRRRAESVAAVLTPALASQSLTFGVDGKGETEPVADNGSEEGRQANRRVTITYTTGES